VVEMLEHIEGYFDGEHVWIEAKYDKDEGKIILIWNTDNAHHELVITDVASFEKFVKKEVE